MKWKGLDGGILLPCRGFPKMVAFPNNHGVFPLKMIILGVFWGYQHLRKHPCRASSPFEKNIFWEGSFEHSSQIDLHGMYGTNLFIAMNRSYIVGSVVACAGKWMVASIINIKKAWHVYFSQSHFFVSEFHDGSL